MLRDGDGIEQDKKETAKYYIRAADNGNNYSMFNYGVMLHEGDGIEQDKKGAAHYYKMSADNGDSLGMHEYGKALLTGDGCNVNKKEAAKYLQKYTEDNSQSENNRPLIAEDVASISEEKIQAQPKNNIPIDSEWA